MLSLLFAVCYATGCYMISHLPGKTGQRSVAMPTNIFVIDCGGDPPRSRPLRRMLQYVASIFMVIRQHNWNGSRCCPFYLITFTVMLATNQGWRHGF